MLKFKRFLVASVGSVAFLTTSTVQAIPRKPVTHKHNRVHTQLRPNTHASALRAYRPDTTYHAINDSQLMLQSAKALVVNQDTGQILYAKDPDSLTPIASLTKLMTAMVVLDADLDMDQVLTVSDADVDMIKGSSSRLTVGTSLSRSQMLQLALMSSENRAASLLSRYYPGGREAFIRAMNQKAKDLGLINTYFVESTGLDQRNMSTARDLVKLAAEAYKYSMIRAISTSPFQEFMVEGRGYPTLFKNTNILVRENRGNWDIGLSKTGYISEAGRCLVMQARVSDQPVIMVLLDSGGKLTRVQDANRIRHWVERLPKQIPNA